MTPPPTNTDVGELPSKTVFPSDQGGGENLPARTPKRSHELDTTQKQERQNLQRQEEPPEPTGAQKAGRGRPLRR